jgi:hypothetical protein
VIETMVAANPANCLSVIVIAQDGEILSPGVLSVLRKHITLVCRNVQQAVNAASSFGPDVVLIDHQATDQAVLERSLAGIDVMPTFIRLVSTQSFDPEYRAAYCRSSSELAEQLSRLAASTWRRPVFASA